VISRGEATRLLREIEKDGVTEEEVKTVVDTLKSALAGGPDSIDINTSGRRKVLNNLLGKLNEHQALPINRPEGSRPSGSVNWLQLMTQQSQAIAAPLSKPSLAGKAVSIDNKGELLLDNKRLSFEGTPSNELNEALWALNRPGQLSELNDKTREALSQNLLQLTERNSGVPNDQPGKYKMLVSATAASSVLADMADKWDSTTVDSVLKLVNKAPAPMMKSLLLRGLDRANLSPEQKAAREAIEFPAQSDELLKRFDETREEKSRISWSDVKGEAAQFALNAITFARNKDALDNISEGMGHWKDLNRDHSVTWDGEEISHMSKILEEYVDKYPQTSYIYGTFAQDALKDIGNITSARATEKVMPQLDADPPQLANFPLTREQADYIKTLLPNIRDDKAVENLVKVLGQADGIFKDSLPSTWGSSTPPSSPMPQASFELLREAVSAYQETAGGSKDGKLGYDDLLNSFRNHTGELHKAIKPRFSELDAEPPRWQEATLSPEAAQYVREQLSTHLRSGMSVDNIGRAIDVVAQAHGGKIEGAAFTQFQQIVEDYKSNWPEAKVFDFNKLERIASYTVQGKEVPLCTINGQTIGLAEFYSKVGLDVTKSTQADNLRHAWIPDRWGYRAKESVELLDVVAEQTLRNEGPVALLRERFPGHSVEIQATGCDGAHEQFLYSVKKDGREVGLFAQGSGGQLERYNGRNAPVLFTASVGTEGELDVKIPDKITTSRIPLQNNYGVGTKIDVPWRDPEASETQEEGKPFTTTSRVLEGEIMSFDAKGNYEVKYTIPNGEEVTKTLSLADIKRANNPHFFRTTSSYFSDVNININSDEDLRKFLEEAQPIIDQYLPADGSTALLSVQELARRQKDCISALMKYTRERNKYPASKDSNPDAASARYHELTEGYGRFPLGELVKIQKGVCRHQCILQHLLLQQAGIESRLASGAANTSSGDFRGYHIWVEVNLADNSRHLSDQTWNDVAVPLWDGAYNKDLRRVEMYNRTARYDYATEINN
jgi:transglutaminase-like putative cysteine protease